MAQGHCLLLGGFLPGTGGEAQIPGLGTWQSNMANFLQDRAPFVPLTVVQMGSKDTRAFPQKPRSWEVVGQCGQQLRSKLVGGRQASHSAGHQPCGCLQIRTCAHEGRGEEEEEDTGKGGQEARCLGGGQYLKGTDLSFEGEKRSCQLHGILLLLGQLLKTLYSCPHRL